MRLVTLLAPERARAALAALLLVLTVGAGVALLGTSGWLLSAAALQPSIAALSLAVVGVRAFGVSRAVLRYLERLASHDVTLRLLARLRVTVFRALVPLAPARLVSRRAGDLLSRLVEDVASLEALYVRVLGPSLAAVLLVLLAGLAILPFGLHLAVALLAGLALCGTLVPWLAWRLGRGPGQRLAALRGELAARLVDGVQGQAELLAFGGEDDHARAVARLSRGAVAEQQRLARASALGTALVGLGTDLTTFGVLALAVPAVRSGVLDGVHLAVVTLLALASFEAVAALPAAWQGLGAAGESARRVFETIDLAPAVRDPALPAPSTGSPRVLEVRDLRFAYPGETMRVLDGVSLRLEPGRRVAVVGRSGSGKSTLVHLLLRFWDVTQGAVALDGRDVREWPQERVRSAIAFAAQRAQLFTGSLRENLLLAAPGASEDELRAVLADVRLETLVARLPAGLDTWVGEQGQQLSGGERQRLALARALLRPRAPFLLLDEPTSHLDPTTEREVLAAIVRAGEGRATLLVTHRLVGLESFDEVAVMERGRIVERGRAAQLREAGGRFARLLALQSASALLAGESPSDAEGGDTP
jgi:thiol reductant ABC exporter CydC subunit